MSIIFWVVASAIISPILSQHPNITFDFPIGQCNPDPWVIQPGPLNLTANPFLNFSDGSSHSTAISIGLHGLNIEVNFNMLLMLISFKIQLPNVHLISPHYIASGAMDFRPFRQSTFPSGIFHGKGLAILSLDNLYIEGSMLLSTEVMLPYVKFRWTKISTLNFTSASSHLGLFEVDDEKFDWDEWSRDFKSNFDNDWADMSIRNETLAKFTTTINKILGTNLGLAEFIEFLQNPCPSK